MRRIIGTVGVTLVLVAAIAVSAAPASAGGYHSGGINVGLADGSVRFIGD